jgi:CheY-like chemotaxis protein
MPVEGPLILVVDDDPDALQILKCILETGSYRVICAPDPESGLELVAEEKPALVITDLMMAAFDSGFSLSEQIKADVRLGDVPVLIITAIDSRLGLNFSPKKPEDLEAMHADAYLEKPVAPQALLMKVKELVGTPR